MSAMKDLAVYVVTNSRDVLAQIVEHNGLDQTIKELTEIARIDGNLLKELQKFNYEKSDSIPTYRQLLQQLLLLSDEQLDTNVTVALTLSEECVGASLDIV